jgi:glycine oxidase
MADVVVIGAGIIGCASALALARRGISTLVLERGTPGAEASSAAAGVVGGQVEAQRGGPGPLSRLCLTARAGFAPWVARLREETGIDPGYRPCGFTMAAYDDEELGAMRRGAVWQEREGLRIEHLDRAGLLAVEPAVTSEVIGGVRFPDDGTVDPPALVTAVRVAAERAGARFRTGALVRRVVVEGGRARGVLLEDGSLVEGDRVVISAGSWSAFVDGAGLPDGALRPARGQIIELRMPVPPLRGALESLYAYLSPRDDGRVLVGSTVEFVGFRPGVTAAAVRDLLVAATRLLPALGEASVSRTWSGFRPCSKDELPLLGASYVAGLIIATGHFRNGVLLAPLTGEIVVALATGAPPPVDLAPFAPQRLLS